MGSMSQSQHYYIDVNLWLLAPVLCWDGSTVRMRLYCLFSLAPVLYGLDFRAAGVKLGYTTKETNGESVVVVQ